MSIKIRLLLSYAVMLLTPIIMVVVIANLAGDYYFNDFQKYGFKQPVTTVKGVLTERDKLFSEIKEIILESPENLLTEPTLTELDAKLQNGSSGIIIRKDNDIIYASPNLNTFKNNLALPKFGEFQQDIFVKPKNKSTKLILSQQDFYFSDKSKGSVFFITDVRPLISIFKSLSLTVVISVIVILVFTYSILAYIIARRIINPLSKLRASADRIKDGDLDFNVDIISKDEIGELSTAFDEMRQRLKGSLELQLQYENNRRELLSNISHDLRTPITAIKGYVEGIRDGVADTPEKMDRYINTIYSKAADADRLIEELFLYSKLELSKLQFNFTEVNIVKYLNDCMEELQFDLDKRNLTIVFDAKGCSELYVKADVQQLKRVIINIVENTIKYMDKAKGSIDIELESDQEQVLVAFKDNGQGISKEALPYIFDRFYRADLSRNSATGGSGLGLSIARRIIEEHGGTMHAESIEGEGTTISFTLKKVVK